MNNSDTESFFQILIATEIKIYICRNECQQIADLGNNYYARTILCII